jgi:tetratricopeptide (TPR) repeat protein
MLARVVGDKVSERRAIRGLGAAKRQMGDRLGAIEDLKQVLSVSQELNDDTGDMDALGAIADLYTELGDLENAGRYYDLYLNQINDETVELED